MEGTMLDEQKRLKELVNTLFKEKDTGIIWRVSSTSHNIYKDVVLRLVSPTGKSRELVEGSEEYYKNFSRVDL